MSLRRLSQLLFVSSWLLIGSCQAQAPAPCPASSSWLTGQPPSEIPGGGQNLCQFYQFSWQWFLFLVSPSTTNPGMRNFEVQANFPLLQNPNSNPVNQNPTTATSCGLTSTSKVANHALFVRTTKKTLATSTGVVIPSETGQAGGGATIYDQNGNVVFYESRFSQNVCTLPATASNFAPNTVEIKLAWRILNPNDPGLDTYYKVNTVITGVNNGQPVLLGLIGFHLVVSTPLHPEFVWATFEHKSNAPNCFGPSTAPAAGWSFNNKACAACLSANPLNGPNICVGNKQCTTMNVALDNQASITGTPTPICRTWIAGTAPADNQAATNLFDVTTLNAQINGPGGILTRLAATDPMSVWQNYRNDGAIWENNVSQPSSVTSNLRGSIELASPIAETTFQGTLQAGPPPVVPGAKPNCFSCHTYTPGNNIGISHIYAPAPAPTPTPSPAPK